MIVLETQEISPDGNNTRYVTAVTQTVIKTVDAQGYPYYYSRDNGKLRCSAQSSRIMEDRTLFGLSRIEDFVDRYGYSPVVLGRFTWNGGLRPYLNADKRPDGSSVSIRSIKGLKILKIK